MLHIIMLTVQSQCLQASGDGMNGYVVLGLSVAGLAVTMFTGYAIYYGKGRKKRRAGRRK